MKRVIYVHGRVYKDNFYCPWCDVRRTGRIIKECYKWRAELTCGHVVNRGFTLPWEELERKKYINQKGSEDPRFTAKKRELFLGMMKRFEEAKQQHWVKNNLAGGKRFL